VGMLVQLLIVMKGLPLTYGKDMQDDKAPTFAATDTIALGLAAATGMVRDLVANTERMRAATETGFITATDLADWLVRKLALPFRNAHHVTGELVRRAESQGISLDKLPLAELQAVEPRITADIYTVLSAEHSAASRKSFGGTAPENVRIAAAAARERFL
ncbi:MAG TPA: argininosuccinate lyase, partial [Dongiaceae bacterium]